MALCPMNVRRGQKVYVAPPVYSQRTKVERGGGGCAGAGVPLETRQSCDALEVDHQTRLPLCKASFLTQR